MKIIVTQEDIDRGEPTECGRCPVARAIKRATGRKRLKVWTAMVIISQKRFSLSQRVTDFIYAFDNAEPVKPFSFSLPLEKLE